MQKELFAKAWGMEASAIPHQQELEMCRDAAIKIAAQKNQVTIDDVRDYLPNLEYGNWAGSIFKSEDWICIGFTPSRHKNSHARIVRVWKRK